MSVLVNMHMSKIMGTLIKLGIRMYAMYANCQSLTCAHHSLYTYAK